MTQFTVNDRVTIEGRVKQVDDRTGPGATVLVDLGFAHLWLDSRRLRLVDARETATNPAAAAMETR